jgi:hypothetical protein
MVLAEGIRKHGFRKWYERQLLRGHGHMALTFLCTVGLIGALESASQARQGSERLADIGTMLLCAAAGLWSMRRYLRLLSHAEAVANQANCPACGTYARLALVRPTHDGRSAVVRCKACTQEWEILG